MFEIINTEIISNGTINTGVRVYFEKEHWEYNFRTKSYTRIRKAIPQYTAYGKLIEGLPDKVDKYRNINHLKKRLGHCKDLMKNLILMAKFYENFGQ